MMNIRRGAFDDVCKATGTNVAYMHRKAFKKHVVKHMFETISIAGYEVV